MKPLDHSPFVLFTEINLAARCYKRSAIYLMQFFNQIAFFSGEMHRLPIASKTPIRLDLEIWKTIPLFATNISNTHKYFYHLKIFFQTHFVLYIFYPTV